MVGPTGTRAPPAEGDLGRIGLPRRHEVLHRLERRIGGHEDALLLLDHLGQRGGVRGAGLRAVGVGGADDAEAHHHHQVPPVAALVHQPGHRDRATGADDVEHLHAAGDVVVFHDLHRGTRGEVIATTRAVRHHHAQSMETAFVSAGHPPAGREQHRGDHRHDNPPGSHAGDPRAAARTEHVVPPNHLVVMLSNTGPGK